ncbi:MAG: hypothetical protein ACI84E_001928 [Planctomycetota bacterium]
MAKGPLGALGCEDSCFGLGEVGLGVEGWQGWMDNGGMNSSRWILVGLGCMLPVVLGFGPGLDEDAEARFKVGFDTVTLPEVLGHVNYLASPELEGRDTPSRGLDLAADYIAAHLQSYGLEGLGPEGSFILPWTFPEQLEAPVADGCMLELEVGDDPKVEFKLAKDFTALPGANGEAEGELSFLGFGIHAPDDNYDDLKGGKMKDKIALVLWEEPRHKRVLDGPEISEAANIFTKLKGLKKEGVRGVIFVRRPAPDNAVDKRGKLLKGGLPPVEIPGERDQEEDAEPELDFGFHHTWATWNVPAGERLEKPALPAVEVSLEVASALLGEDVIKLAEKMDKSGKSTRKHPKGRIVRFTAQTEERSMEAPNVVALLRGSDPELADQYIVLGAHMDHLGVGFRGRMAAGADDNASGIAALLEVAQALVEAKPRRSYIFAAFSGEEDGLLGSKALCDAPPIPSEKWIAMINMDMIGVGKDSESIVLGVRRNPDLGEVLERAMKLKKSGIKKVVTLKGEELWRRSDHFSFHSVGVPVLFFFEALPISDNHDYHTWRDMPASVDFTKVTNTARLVYNTAWLLGQEDEIPSEPRN